MKYYREFATCSNIECTNPVENNNTGLCASCSRALRKKAKEALKPKAKRKPIAKVGNKNTWLCSDGSRVTQQQIDQMLSGHAAKYKQTICEGCGKELAVCRAHIIAKSRCKAIGKTELIWDSNNMFDSCFACNLAIENPQGNAWKQLKNIDRCLKFIEQHDAELFVKFSLSRLQKEHTI